MSLDLNGKTLKSLIYILDIKRSYYSSLTTQFKEERSTRLEAAMDNTWTEMNMIVTEIKRKILDNDIQ